MNTNTNRRMYTERTPRSINIYAMNNTTQQPSTVITNCLHCSKEFSFYPRSKGLKYCSRRCSNGSRSNNVEIRCAVCNIILEKKSRKYCSKQCHIKGKTKEGTEERNKKRRKQYILEHREYFKTRAKKSYEKHKKKYKERSKIRRKDPEYRKKKAEYQNNWLKNLKDPVFKLKNRLRSRLTSALKSKNAIKQLSAIALIGCSIEDLKKHIESQWLPGMTWENHTLKGWHIDHIKPCNTFDLTNLEEQKKCFHYTNLRPLWSFDNKSRPHDGSDV